MIHWTSPYRGSPDPSPGLPLCIRSPRVMALASLLLHTGPPSETLIDLFLTFCGLDWRPVQTYSLEDPTASDIWWPRLKTVSNLFTWGPLLVLTTGAWPLKYIYGEWVACIPLGWVIVFIFQIANRIVNILTFTQSIKGLWYLSFFKILDYDMMYYRK